ncbi:MAG TPA: hypothetical protein VME19_00995 [Streptosporangiaceae bacterium]|nr:hypothetical protein [Streptosporangiaceae bacterium]
MTGDPDVIGLLQRADWTRPSISATVNDGSTLLIAPGRRYREQTADGIRGCDGERRWMRPAHAPDLAVHVTHGLDGPEPPLRTLLCPAWLGFGGLGLLISTVGDRIGASHKVSFLRVGGPGRNSGCISRLACPSRRKSNRPTHRGRSLR